MVKKDLEGLTRRQFITTTGALTAGAVGLVTKTASAQELSDLLTQDNEIARKIHNFGSVENFVWHYKKAKGIIRPSYTESDAYSNLASVQQEINLTPYLGPLVLPDEGKVGWYMTDFGHGVLMYHGKDHQMQIIAWMNNNQSSLEQVTGTIESFRGYGQFISDKELFVPMYTRGNTIVPDESSFVNWFRISTSGNVTDMFGSNFRLYNAMFPDGSLFFGESDQDGVYFSSQWASIINADGDGRTMVLLNKRVSPWLLDWDLEAFGITKGNRTIFVLPAIGEGRTGTEYIQVVRDIDGILKGTEPFCPSEFNNIPGCSGVEVAVPTVVPYAVDWWLEHDPDPNALITRINGRAILAPTREKKYLIDYPKQGAVFYDPSLFPEIKPFSGSSLKR